jgi:hypothetical protein
LKALRAAGISGQFAVNEAAVKDDVLRKSFLPPGLGKRQFSVPNLNIKHRMGMPPLSHHPATQGTGAAGDLEPGAIVVLRSVKGDIPAPNE